MLDINFIREHPEIVKANNIRRKCNVQVDEILTLDTELRTATKVLDELRAERNRSARQGKPSPEEIERLRLQGDEIKLLESTQREKEEKLQELLSWLPNLLSPDVPHGKDDADNKELKTWGRIPQFLELFFLFSL